MTDYEVEQLELRKLQIKYGSMYYTLPDTYAEKNEAYTAAFNAGKNFVVGYDVFIYRTHGLRGRITIGENVFIGDHCTVDYSGELLIGDNVRIAEGTKIYSHKHPNFDIIKREKGGAVPVKTTIENDVWIDAGCIIYPGVTIGEHAVVYAGSVVMESIEPYGVVAGNPARDIREIVLERRKKKKREGSL